ncbi:MAG: hypothetical protein KME60_13910 [Cyanomargarita calcarea GSE-NOS-MK-12-04C]|jgi:hypothetical protein|uniref:Glutathione S-transferase n=1 Tax=Cyanomargarita calcarea GSE-NOS-MK-12-04C TaxID=2839659 RepID=A0A951QP02_9CYAN|nr:hypothetical protein [Cyanomargarita calcarea GSE-NOS-MK-12-04C]
MERKVILFIVLGVITSLLIGFTSYWGEAALSLPPKEDIPEEILRTEIIIEARSPIDGKSLSAAEYAELQAKLQISPPPKLDPKIRENIFLLRLRKGLRQIFPFLNF